MFRIRVQVGMHTWDANYLQVFYGFYLLVNWVLVGYSFTFLL